MYPWGNDNPDCSRLNYTPIWPTGCVGDTSQVGSYPTGASPYGVMDMAANVWEWVNDWHQYDYYDNSHYGNPPGPPSGTVKVFRGGGFCNVGHAVRAAYRPHSTPSLRTYGIGFRCAKSGAAPTYSISGHVRDGSGGPISGVTVSGGEGGSATTDASGDYTITGLLTGTYTLTPTKGSWVFSPPTLTVSVPPSATGQDFTGSDFASDLTSFVTDSREQILAASRGASDISQVDDYFLDKQNADEARRIINSTYADSS